MKRLYPTISLLCALATGAAPAAAKPTRQPAAPTAAAALAPEAVERSIGAFDAHAGMGHPRLFRGQNDYAGIVAATRAERSRGIAAMVDTLKRHPLSAEAPELRTQVASSNQAARMAGWWKHDRLLEGMAESAFGWYVTRQDWLLDEMRARMRLFGNAVLARDCVGDIAETRDYVWYFALAYDFAYDAMSRAEREMVGDVIVACADAGLSKTPAVLRAHPENGIAFNALGKLVGALLIVRGDMPDTRRLLAAALPAYVASLSPWGGEDGGFSNGSSYAMWDAGESLLAWDLIERVLGVPIYRKPWLAALPRYLAYVVPPGTPAGAFGDGAEVNRGEEWARLGKAITYRSDSPMARWYASELRGDDYGRLNILLSPRAYQGDANLNGAPNGASFPSVGVAAMHSQLSDRDRVTVLFKSSPFGSLNHSHADQNSFVLYAKGKVLAMDSGVYDSYGSPHWRNWYKQTRAHNAITYDGGEGQELGPLGLGDRQHDGRIVRFESKGGYDLVTGDAAAAYGGELRRALRTLVYIRPATLVVIDQLGSSRPRSWEWNLHTPAPLSGDPDSFKANVDGVGLCGTVRADAPLKMVSTSGYTPAPAKPAGPHHWSRMVFTDPARSALFVSVLRVDCAGPAPRIDIGDDGATVVAGGRTIKLDGDAVSVVK
ncbi:MAG: heparinase II/III family protein [Gammaproteobacteria bacterium]